MSESKTNFRVRYAEITRSAKAASKTAKMSIKNKEETRIFAAFRKRAKEDVRVPPKVSTTSGVRR